MRLRDFLEDHWWAAVERTVRASTFASYRSHVTVHVLPRLGAMPLHSVDANALNTFYARLLARGRARGRGGLSPSAVARIHATLHRALRDAVRWGYLPEIAADRADPPRAGNHEMTCWSPDELRTFLRSARNDDLYVLWFVLAMTGMRRGEALGLRWTDLDVAGARVAVRRSIIAIGHEVHVSSPKTRQGCRTIALAPSHAGCQHLMEEPRGRTRGLLGLRESIRSTRVALRRR